MAKVTLNEAAAPGTPATAKVAIYAKADGKVYCKDDAGTESDLTAGSGTISRVASLGAAPTNSQFRIKTGPPDELWVSAQKTGAAWDWGFVMRMP